MSASVGIFWLVDGELVAVGCAIAEASAYGDCLTYDGGHAEHWDSWRDAGAGWLRAHGLPQAILTTEYEAHPRGRIVHDGEGFVIYADRRLQGRATVRLIRERFDLVDVPVRVRGDPHYR